VVGAEASGRDGRLELGRRQRREAGLGRAAWFLGERFHHDAAVEEAGQQPHDAELGQPSLIGRPAERAREQQDLQRRGVRQLGREDRQVEQRVVLAGELPVDQP
jgi:hypothetical protein